MLHASILFETEQSAAKPMPVPAEPAWIDVIK